MMQRRASRISACGGLFAALVAVLLLAGCSDDDNDTDNAASVPEMPAPTTPAENTPPVAAAGMDQNVKTGAAVTLDGSASRDADDDTLDYAWTLTAPTGSQAKLSDTQAAKPMFTADEPGRYEARLVVDDGEAESEADTVVITAATANSAPVAMAGDDVNATAGQPVTLDGSASSDADADTLTYAWTLTDRPEGSATTLTDAETVRPMFTPDIAGTYTAELTVNDGSLDSEADSVTVTVAAANSVPVADAGADRDVVTGKTVALDGSASRDADGDPLSYRWSFVSRPDGAEVNLSSADTVAPEFTPDVAGEYVVRLVTSDGEADSASDTVVITAARANARPTAVADGDQQVIVGNTVSLDGAASSDADGDMLTYDWTFTSTPADSQAGLVDGNSASPMFTPDVAGDYVLRLVVNDGQADSAADTVTVTAAQANVAPVADAGADDSVKTGVMVTLDGTASSDANDDALTYEWRVVSTPPASETALVNAAMAQAAFTPDVDGVYVFELVVNDGELDSAPDRVEITAATPNSAPTADAGDDQQVVTGERVNLDGSASQDADNDALSYEWSFQSRPAGAEGSLSDADTANPSFTPDAGGDYVVRLMVSDGQGEDASDTVRITAVMPDIQLAEEDFLDGFESRNLPYRLNGQAAISTTASFCELGLYRLTATDGDFTIRNLEAVKTSGTSTAGGMPSFGGLRDGQTIRAGQSVTFSLDITPTRGRQVGVRYAFEIAETGDTFVANYQAACN